MKAGAFYRLSYATIIISVRQRFRAIIPRDKEVWETGGPGEYGHSNSGHRKWLYVLFSVACLTWLVLRSGRRPWRLRYPCQQVAAIHSAWILPAAGIWLAGFIRSPGARRALVVGLLFTLLAFMVVGLGGDLPSSAAGRSAPDTAQAQARAACVSPAEWRGQASDGKHDVFAVTHVPAPAAGSAHHPGVDSLIRLLADSGVHLYKTGRETDGLVAANDVVLLKVNAAWDERGMTNTDVVRGLIAAVLEHPGGFTGEVVLVENCEGGPDYDQVTNNAENTGQSFQSVVNSFGDWSRVSSSSWWSFTDNVVGEYDTGDGRDGYVWLGNNVAYPKFTTGRGTQVSLRNGVWTGSGYDKSRLKLINVPVLKSHNAAGVTGCLKNYMGVQSTHLTTNVHGDLIYGGFMGRMMNETVYPCLNVLDAIWISPSHPRGPEGPYSLAVRTDALLAGLDPVAVDYYAAKNVLYPVSGYGRHDPDTPYTEGTDPYHDGSTNTGYPYNAFRIMLDTTTAALQQGGHDVTSDPARMGVHVRDMGGGTSRTGGHCVTGVAEPAKSWHFAEGTTRAGFDEYICLENPQVKPAHASLRFMTGFGQTIPYAVDIAPLSRQTVNVNEVVGEEQDVSCSVTSDLPIVAERPMYFFYRGGWTGGHSVVGAKAPAKTWYFAEGYTGEGFETWVCVLNPGDDPASLVFRFQTQEAGEVVRTGQSVPAHSRATFQVNELLGPGYQSSLELQSDRPVIAERPMYFDYLGRGSHHWDGGHCVMGVTRLSKEYFLAEGTTRPGFEEWLTLQNPNPSPIEVKATYLLGSGQGEPVTRKYMVEGRRRHTVFVRDEVGPDRDVSVRLSSASLFLAERPMYFRYQGPGADWTGGHCVTGVPAPYPECHFAEGYTGGGFHEWLCLQNHGDAGATVEVDYYTQESGALPPRTVFVPAGTRVTVKVNDNAGPDYQLSCRLRVTSGPPIVAERPMYFDYR